MTRAVLRRGGIATETPVAFIVAAKNLQRSEMSFAGGMTSRLVSGAFQACPPRRADGASAANRDRFVTQPHRAGGML
jgi:hypothetical protein